MEGRKQHDGNPSGPAIGRSLPRVRRILSAAILVAVVAVSLAGVTATASDAGDGGGYGGSGGGSIWAMTWWDGSPQGPGPYTGGPSGTANLCVWQDAGNSLANLDGLLATAGLPASFWTVPRGGSLHGIWGVNLWAAGLLQQATASDHFDVVVCPEPGQVPASGPGIETGFPTVLTPSGRIMYLWLYWDTVPDPPPGALPPLIGDAYASARLPAPSIETSPASIDGISDATVVNFPTWLWIGPGAWHTVVATASGGGLVATVWAVPVAVAWHAAWNLPSPLDDPQRGVTLAPEQVDLTCAGPGTAYNPGRPPDAQSSACVATFSQSTFGTSQALSASITWQVHWALSNDAGVVGGEGTLADTVTTSTRGLRVLQVESVIAGTAGT